MIHQKLRRSIAQEAKHREVADPPDVEGSFPHVNVTKRAAVTSVVMKQAFLLSFISGSGEGVSLSKQIPGAKTFRAVYQAEYGGFCVLLARF